MGGNAEFDSVFAIDTPYTRAKLQALIPELKQLLPAHNTAQVDPEQLRKAANAVQRIRSGEVQGNLEPGNQLVFNVEDIEIITARPVLDGTKSDTTHGGSGLTTWPTLRKKTI